MDYDPPSEKKPTSNVRVTSFVLLSLLSWLLLLLLFLLRGSLDIELAFTNQDFSVVQGIENPTQEAQAKRGR